MKRLLIAVAALAVLAMPSFAKPLNLSHKVGVMTTLDYGYPRVGASLDMGTLTNSTSDFQISLGGYVAQQRNGTGNRFSAGPQANLEFTPLHVYVAMGYDMTKQGQKPVVFMGLKF